MYDGTSNMFSLEAALKEHSVDPRSANHSANGGRVWHAFSRLRLCSWLDRNRPALIFPPYILQSSTVHHPTPAPRGELIYGNVDEVA